MNTINYFVAETDLPEQDSSKSYGPMGSSQYRVTSVFNGDNDIMAYAVTNGVVFIVDQDDNSDRVNLILAPDGVSFGAPVKYFVYRGLKKSDFLDENNSYQGIRPTDSDDSDFIKNLRKGQNGEVVLELYDDLTDDYFIDNLFESDDYQFGIVKQGDSIGRFDSQDDYGFEIMLDEAFSTPTLGIVRLPVNIIEVTEGDEEISRLEMLYYIDPAAYYGLFSHNASSVGTNNSSSPKSRSKDGVYEFIKQFYTKNAVYIDIRDRYENPIDWFEEAPQTIKITTDGTPAITSSDVPYRGDDQFPVKILISTFSNSQTNDIGQEYYNLNLSLPITNNDTPLLTLYIGYWSKFASEIIEDMYFSTCSIDNPDWSDDKGFAIFSAEDNGVSVPIATYIKIELGEYINIDFINNQIPNSDDDDDDSGTESDPDFNIQGLFPFHIDGIPEYQAPTN